VKIYVKLILQQILGFRNYLFLFSLFIIKKLKWDKNESDFLHFLRLLPPGGIVLDIGANIGVMSYYLAKNYPDRKVYAFEPIPYNYANLLRIKKKYELENLYTMQLALGDEEGEIEMLLPVEKSVRFHGLAQVKKHIDNAVGGEIFTCPIRKLDGLEELPESSMPLTGIKIDVENFEYFVLKGGEKLISKHKPLIYCELWDNENRLSTMELLSSLGYEVLILKYGTLRTWEPSEDKTQNFFFRAKKKVTESITFPKTI
jgi:FkbM family methyltransferase